MKYVCLSHNPPLPFLNVYRIYEHIIYEHGDCFIRIPFHAWEGKPDDRCKEFVCKCGETGFKNLRQLIKHLNECQGIHIIYQKGILKPMLYSDGFSQDTARKLIKKRKTIHEVALNLNIPETADVADRLAEEYRQKVKIPRTIYVDAAE